MRGLERRITSGLSLDVRSVASLFVSRWDKATMDNCLRTCGTDQASQSPNRPTPRIAISSTRNAGSALKIAERARNAFCSPALGRRPARFRHALHQRFGGAQHHQQVPEETLLHFADHGEVGSILPRDGGRASETLSAIGKAGVDLGVRSLELIAQANRIVSLTRHDPVAKALPLRDYVERKASSP
jgi:transaldolase